MSVLQQSQKIKKSLSYPLGKNFKSGMKATFTSIVTWSWTKRLFVWIVTSAGVASELLFLLASVWMSVNANAHAFILSLGVTETQTINLSSLSTIAYVALPECIVLLAVQTTIGHIERVFYFGKQKNVEMLTTEIVWLILFGLPTVLFLYLSFLTLSLSVQSLTVTLPPWAVSLRADAAYEYAVAAAVYIGTGAPKIAKELQKRDTTITQLQQESEVRLAQLTQEKDGVIEDLNQQITFLNDKIENQNMILSTVKKQSETLKNEIHKASEAALEAYGYKVIDLLNSDNKTVSIATITQLTGHSRAKIKGAIKRGMLITSTRNTELIIISSLAEWLKQTPPPNRDTSDNDGDDSAPILRLVNE